MAEASVDDMCRKIGRSSMVRFAVVGAGNTAVHYAVYLVLWLVLPYLLAHLCAMVVAMVCSYLLNCHFTFRVRPRWRTFLMFPLSNVTNVVFSTTGVFLAVACIGIDSRIAPIIGGAIAIPATFLVSKVVLTGQLAATTVPSPRPEVSRAQRGRLLT
jgi:putative flippase GtrA